MRYGRSNRRNTRAEKREVEKIVRRTRFRQLGEDKMKKCENCGRDCLDWQKICRACYAKSKSGAEQTNANSQKPLDREHLIIKQTLFKCAAQVMPQGTTPEALVTFAKKLETGFYQ